LMVDRVGFEPANSGDKGSLNLHYFLFFSQIECPSNISQPFKRHSFQYETRSKKEYNREPNQDSSINNKEKD
jgi:hypothetical protein